MIICIIKFFCIIFCKNIYFSFWYLFFKKSKIIFTYLAFILIFVFTDIIVRKTFSAVWAFFYTFPIIKIFIYIVIFTIINTLFLFSNKIIIIFWTLLKRGAFIFSICCKIIIIRTFYNTICRIWRFWFIYIIIFTRSTIIFNTVSTIITSTTCFIAWLIVIIILVKIKIWRFSCFISAIFKFTINLKLFGYW